MYRYLIVVEKSQNNYSAYSPDLAGCIATGPTVEEVKERMQTAITMHVHGLLEDHLSVPEPQSFAEYVAIQ